MRTPIYLRRGNKADLPALLVGEPGFATDTKKLYIGATGGNAQVAMATQESWIAPTLLNSWTAFGGYMLGYYRDDLNDVKIFMRINSGITASGTQLFTLPVGYRPTVLLTLTGDTNSGTTDHKNAIITVDTDGKVAIGETGSLSWLSLSLSFRAE